MKRGSIMNNSTQKQIIVLHTDNSRFFEQAHFILRAEPCDENSMVTEANRIIARAEAGRIYGKHRPKPSFLSSRLFFFLAGVFTTLAAGAISTLLIHLLF